MSEMAVEQVKRAARLSSRTERVQLATWLLDTEEHVSGDPRSLYGLLAASGFSPDETTIDDARREVWRNFPREDIA